MRLCQSTHFPLPSFISTVQPFPLSGLPAFSPPSSSSHLQPAGVCFLQAVFPDCSLTQCSEFWIAAIWMLIFAHDRAGTSVPVPVLGGLAGPSGQTTLGKHRGRLQGLPGSSETPLWHLAHCFSLEEGKGHSSSESAGKAMPGL